MLDLTDNLLSFDYPEACVQIPDEECEKVFLEDAQEEPFIISIHASLYVVEELVCYGWKTRALKKKANITYRLKLKRANEEDITVETRTVLEKVLKRLVEAEEYEEAAKVRDMIDSYRKK